MNPLEQLKTIQQSFDATKQKLEEARVKQFPHSTKPKENNHGNH